MERASLVELQLTGTKQDLLTVTGESDAEVGGVDRHLPLLARATKNAHDLRRESVTRCRWDDFLQ
jgi:hypothetical protein